MGFGHADLVVAVPAAWVDVETMHDLDEAAHEFRRRHGHRLRIATKYHNLARGFLRRHGVADYRLVDSQGATEAGPKNLTAEAIIDITTSGATLRANHLRPLERRADPAEPGHALRQPDGGMGRAAPARCWRRWRRGSPSPQPDRGRASVGGLERGRVDDRFPSRRAWSSIAVRSAIPAASISVQIERSAMLRIEGSTGAKSGSSVVLRTR